MRYITPIVLGILLVVAGYFLWRWNGRVVDLSGWLESSRDSTSMFRQEATDLKLERERAQRQAAEDDRKRTDKDKQIQADVGKLSTQLQRALAERGLQTNGVVPSGYRIDTVMVQDSTLIAGVAAQGQQLTDTKGDLMRANEARRLAEGRASGLEDALNGQNKAITDLQGEVLGQAKGGLWPFNQRRIREHKQNAGKIGRLRKK